MIPGHQYFPHDADARHDPKILAIESMFEMGYSWYFKLIEYLFANGGRLEHNIFFNAVITDQTKCKEPEKFIKEAVKIGLYYWDGKSKIKYLRSHSLDRRIKKIEAKSRAATRSAKTRWEREKISDQTVNDIYAAYPKKVDPDKSKESIRFALAGKIIGAEELLARVKAYAKAVSSLKKTAGLDGDQDRWKYVPGSAPWFRRKGWTEDIVIPKDPFKNARD